MYHCLPRFVLLLTALLSLSFQSVLAQKERMNDQFRKGVECLHEDGVNCTSFFDQSIQASKKLKGDTIDLRQIEKVVAEYKLKGADLTERISFCKAGIKLAKNKENRDFEWRFQLALGESYLLSSDFDKMEIAVDNAMEIAQEEDNPTRICLSLLLRSQQLMSIADYPMAIKTALEAKDYAKRTDNDFLITKGYDILASAYFYNADYMQSAKYVDLTRKLYLEIGDTLNAMYCLTNWCNIQSELGNSKSIINRLPEAIDYFQELKLHSRVVFPMAQLGRAYNAVGDYELATEVLEEAYSESIRLKLDQQAAYCAILLSESHYFLKNPKECLTYSTAAYKYHKERQPSLEYLAAFRKQARALMYNDKYEEASEILVSYIQCKDSIFNKEKMEEIAFLQEKFEVQAKNDKILLLKKEKETIKNRNIGLIAGLILTAIIAWLLVKRKSIKIKLKEAENDKMNIEIENKNKELTSQALHLAQKNELLISLKNDLASISSEESKEDIRSLEQKIRFNEQIDQNWEQFTKFFNETKSNFFKNLSEKHPSVGKNDLRMSALISMNLDSKEIASILNISTDGVKKARYRLRKKLGLESKEDLSGYLTQF